MFQLPKRKRAKISEDESTIAPPPLQGDSESQESAVADMAASDAVDGGCDDSGKDVAEKKNEGQPILLTGGTLRKYQVEGYKWLQVILNLVVYRDSCPPVGSTTAVVDQNSTRFVHLVCIVQQLFS